MTDRRAFKHFVQAVLQSQISNAKVSVQFGRARDASRHFDTDHYGFNIMFTLDPVYMQDPEEVVRIYRSLMEWVAGWNEYPRYGQLTDEQASSITEGITDE